MIKAPFSRSPLAASFLTVLGIFGFLISTPSSATPPAVSSKIAGSLERLTVPPLDAITSGATPKYPWKTNIVGTIFWVGEQPTQNNPTPNTASSWDPKWQLTFGGFDDPSLTSRAAGYRPASFVPKLNPFYVALPYNDVVNYKTHKDEAAKVIPWFKDTFVREGKSVCNNRWIAIRHKDRTCYAQWSDCGPFVTTDHDYVFGDARPVNTKNNGAGIDLAPAVRDYLGFVSGKTCDWRFVDENEVPDGPWKTYGRNNPFAPDFSKVNEMPSYNTAKAKSSSESNLPSARTASSASDRLEELRKQRDLWFSQKGVGNKVR
jgi:hypothetical protein